MGRRMDGKINSKEFEEKKMNCTIQRHDPNPLSMTIDKAIVDTPDMLLRPERRCLGSEQCHGTGQKSNDSNIIELAGI